jgi:GntR family transcriptional regulator, transcriptional repressor for pyruvate dehydrogenase complex
MKYTTNSRDGHTGAVTADLAIEPLRAPKMAEMVAAQIRKSIIDGKLKEGDRLPRELEMIAQFGVSRGVIREALRLLESEQFVQVKRGAHGGAVITGRQHQAMEKATLVSLQMQRTTLGDFYAANTLIEPPAARYATLHNAGNAIAALSAHVARQEHLFESGDELAIADAINEFHFVLLENCGNQSLRIMTTAARAVLEVQIAQLHWAFKPKLPPGVYDEFTHTALRSAQRLIELMKRGDAAGAERHWRKHMEKAGEVFFSVVDPGLLVG